MISKIQIEELMLNAGLAVELQSPIPTDEVFSELGLDSLDVFNIFIELETLTGIQVEKTKVDEIVALMQTKQLREILDKRANLTRTGVRK